MKWEQWLKRSLMVLGIAIMFSGFHHTAFGESLLVGAPRGVGKAMKQWIPLGKHLSQETGSKITVRAAAIADVINEATSKNYDFVLCNPVQSAVLQAQYNAVQIATLNKAAGTQFGGVIVAKTGNGITKSEDLKGKKVMSLKFRGAAGAYIFQTYHLHEKGIDPHKDFASMTEGKNQDQLVTRVKNGSIDAAFIRTGILEAMAKEKKIKLDDFVVVDQRDDGFPLVHTTQLYPEWSLMAMPSADKALVEKVKSAVLSLQASSPAAKAGAIKGFVEPVSLDGLITALTELKIPPFAN